MSAAVPAAGISALLAALLVGLSRFFDDTAAVKRFITAYTNIELVETPLPPQPLTYEVTIDGRPVTQALAPGTPVKWWVKNDDVFRRLLSTGGLGLGETYMDAEWETNSLEGLCDEFLKLEQSEVLRQGLGLRGLQLALSFFSASLRATFLPSGTKEASRKNIASHYDIGAEMYQRMLGPTMQYTCAYFSRPGMSLDEAQRAKMQLVASKLDLRPGMKVLELGCGFGGLAHMLATEYGVHVTGVTLSKDQVDYAHEHYAHPNVDIRLQDYRDVEGKYDRIYSVGIYEHIGRQFYQTYFDLCYDKLVDDGIMLIHTIGWGRRGQWNPNTFMFKYIFPGAELPHMHHFTEDFTDRWHLEDWQSMGKSYPRTARCWLANLRDWSGLDEFDERFRRMWWYYIISCSAGFESRKCKLWQLVYTKANSGRPDDCHHIRAIASAAELPMEGPVPPAVPAASGELERISAEAH